MSLLRSSLSTLFAGLLLLLGCWYFLAPPQLGGKTTVVETRGISMLPHFHQGDLAVVRKQAHYQVGDIVLYTTPLLAGARYLHRIVGGTPSRYVMKGDNNPSVDPAYPTSDQIIGKLVLHVPKAGRLLAGGQPLFLIFGGGLLGLLGALGRGLNGWRRRRSARPARGETKGRRRVRHASGRSLVVLLALAAAALVGEAALLGLPTSKLSSKRALYSLNGQFSYDGPADAGVAYPLGRLSTGEPVYLRQVHQLHVGYRASSGTAGLKLLAGRVRLALELGSGDGWQRQLPLVEQGHGLDATATIDLDQLRRTIKQLESQIGTSQASYSLRVRAVAQLTGRFSGQFTHDTVSSLLDFTLIPPTTLLLDRPKQDTTSAAVAAGPGALPQGPLHPVVLRALTTRVRVPLTVLGVPVPTARVLLGVLLGVCVAIGLAALRRRGTAKLSAAVRLQTIAAAQQAAEAQLAGRLYQAAALGRDGAIELATLEELNRLSSLLNAPLLVHDSGGESVYFCYDAHGREFRYRAAA